MNTGDFLASLQWQWALWILLGVVGAIGLLAIVSPHGFSRLATWCNTWVDTDKLAKKLDQRVDVDSYVLRHSRLFGMVTVAVTLAMASGVMRLPSAGQWVAGALLGGAGAIGLLAMLSPHRFSRLATWCNTWVDTDKLAKKLDQRVDVDSYVLRHSRLFGMLVAAMVLALASLVIWTG